MQEIVLNYGVYYILFVIILLGLFWKFMYSLLDPMIFVILIIASSLCLSIDTSFFTYVCLCTLAFYSAFIIVGRSRVERNVAFLPVGIKFLEIFTVLFFTIYFVVNIILFGQSGIPLFSDDPSMAKVAIFTKGTGWIRRIIFISDFLPVSLILLTIVSKRKLFFLFLLILYMACSILLGSKASLLGIFLMFYFFYTRENLWNSVIKLRFKRIIKKSFKYFITLLVAIFIFIVEKEAEKNQESSNLIYGFGYRLMEFGDATLFYKTHIVQAYFSHFGISDFFKYEFNDIAGMLRLTDYTNPLGYQMVKAFMGRGGDEIMGPNCIFIVRGHIFFGYIGGIVYCFLIGLLFAYLRRKIFESKTQHVFLYAIIVYIFFTLNTMVREFSQFVSTYFDFLLCVIPLIIFSLALTYDGYQKKSPREFRSLLVSA